MNLPESAPVPADPTVLYPPLIVAPMSKAPVRLAQARAAAKRCGLGTLDMSKIKDQAVVGRFIQEQGAVDLGRSRIAFELTRIDEIDASLKEIASEAQGLALDGLSLRLHVAKIRVDLAKVGVEAATKQIDTSHTDEVLGHAPVRQPGFGPSLHVNVANYATGNHAQAPVVEAPLNQLALMG